MLKDGSLEVAAKHPRWIYEASLFPRLRLSTFFGSTVKYGHYHLYFCCSYRACFNGDFIFNGRKAKEQRSSLCILIVCHADNCRSVLRLHPKPDRLPAPYDSGKMHFGALELAWRGARDRLQGCKREDDRWEKRRRRMTTTELQVWERRKLAHMESANNSTGRRTKNRPFLSRVHLPS